MMAEASRSNSATDAATGGTVAVPNNDPKNKSLAELLNDLSKQLAALIHQEVELAKAEVTAKGKRLGAGAGLLGGAAVTALLGLGAAVACVIAALSQALPVWLAALIVGVVLLAIAGVLGLMGKTSIQRASPPVPAEAMESTREDVAWLRAQVKAAKP
jgi:uncharacterized membrane protein YqjE